MAELLANPSLSLASRQSASVVTRPAHWGERWIDSILSRGHYPQGRLLDTLVLEVRELNLEATRSKAPSELASGVKGGRIWEGFLPVLEDGGRRNQHAAMKQTIERTLFVTHPMQFRLRELWAEKYKHLSFFLALDGLADVVPMEVEHFIQLQHAHCRKVRDALLLDWVLDIRKISALLPEFSWVADDQQHDRFLSSINGLLRVQLSLLLLNTGQQLVEFFQACCERSRAVFLLRLVLISDGTICLQPDAPTVLQRLESILDLAKDAACSFPVVHSDLASDLAYPSARVMSEPQAECIVVEARQLLRSGVRSLQVELDSLVSMYSRYEHVLREPYFAFTDEWRDSGVWKQSVSVWAGTFGRMRVLLDDLETLNPSKVHAGIFCIVTSERAWSEPAPARPEQRLILEALSDKAHSLLDHITGTVTEDLSQRAGGLREELRVILAVCGERSTDPQRLMEMLTCTREAQHDSRRLADAARTVKQALDALWGVGHALPDEVAAASLEALYFQATLKARLHDAAMQFHEVKWVIEERLQEERRRIEEAVAGIRADDMERLLGFSSRAHQVEYVASVRELQGRLALIAAQCSRIVSDEEFLGIPALPFLTVDQLAADVKLHLLLWEHSAAVAGALKAWHKLPAVTVNVDRMHSAAQGWQTDLGQMLAHFPAARPCHDLAALLLRQVGKYVRLFPALRVWTCPQLQERHWLHMLTMLRQPPAQSEVAKVTVGDLQAWGAAERVEALGVVARAAASDQRLSDLLDRLSEQWAASSLPVRPLGRTGTLYVESFQEALDTLQDHMLRTDAAGLELARVRDQLRSQPQHDPLPHTHTHGASAQALPSHPSAPSANPQPQLHPPPPLQPHTPSRRCGAR